MKSVSSYALGCKVNQYESEAIAELFSSKGYEVVNIDEKADIYIINTCTVTNLGDKKSRQLIRKVKRQNPEAIVVAVGCYAQVSPEEVAKIDGVNLIIGTKGKNSIVDEVEKYVDTSLVINTVEQIKHEKTFEPLSVKNLKNRTRAYIKIQDGCDRYCSYCIIPYARGPVRSRDKSDILKEVENLSKNRFKEVVLTGIHVASYGLDTGGTSLVDIIKMVSGIAGIENIRLSSIEPNIITEEFVKEISSISKVCRHFHLSLQSGCDKILEKMNRHYTTDEYEKSIQILRKYMPDVSITTDIIVGFPGETEEDFAKTYDFAEKIGFLKIHVFPFSPKTGTLAATMDEQIQNSEKSRRAKMLSQLSDNMNRHFISGYINKNIDVLFEQKVSDRIYEGHTSNYIRVQAESYDDLENKIVSVKVIGVENELALGETISIN